jgi:hypothetical protein
MLSLFCHIGRWQEEGSAASAAVWTSRRYIHVLYLGLEGTQVQSFYFSSYTVGLAEKQAFSMTGRTLVSVLFM